MISFRQKGDFLKTTEFLSASYKGQTAIDYNRYGREGVAALSSATPVDSGETAKSWRYKIEKTNQITRLSFYNDNIQNGTPIAIILQYGHGTKNGGWVEGIDYINPAIQPIFNELANSAWKEVTRR